MLLLSLRFSLPSFGPSVLVQPHLPVPLIVTALSVSIPSHSKLSPLVGGGILFGCSTSPGKHGRLSGVNVRLMQARSEVTETSFVPTASSFGLTFTTIERPSMVYFRGFALGPR